MMTSTIRLSILLIFVSVFATRAFAQAGRFNPGVVKNPNMNEEAVVILLLDEGKGNKAMDFPPNKCCNCGAIICLALFFINFTFDKKLSRSYLFF